MFSQENCPEIEIKFFSTTLVFDTFGYNILLSTSAAKEN